MNITDLSSVLAIGLAAGLSPGPTSTLVVSQTLQHGILEGIKVGLSPLLTDGPILLVMLFLLKSFQASPIVLPTVSICGGLFLLYLAYETAKEKAPSQEGIRSAPNSILKGTITNALNPAPYLFWGTVGAPLILKNFGGGTISGVLSIVSFFSMLVGTKCLIAVVAHHSLKLIKGRGYQRFSFLLAITMAIYGLLFIQHGVGDLFTWGAHS